VIKKVFSIFIFMHEIGELCTITSAIFSSQGLS
jgi:hypothetical protein